MPAKRKRARNAIARWKAGGFCSGPVIVSDCVSSDSDSDEYVPARKEARSVIQIDDTDTDTDTESNTPEPEGNEFLINLTDDEAEPPDRELEEEGLYPEKEEEELREEARTHMLALNVLMSARAIRGGPGKAPYRGDSRWAIWRRAREAGGLAESVADCKKLEELFGSQAAKSVPPPPIDLTVDESDEIISIVSSIHWR